MNNLYHNHRTGDIIFPTISVTHLCNKRPKAGKLFFCTKLNVWVSSYCRANKCRQLHSKLMKIATVSGLKNYGGCSSFALSKISKINSLTPHVIAWIKTHVILLVAYGDKKPYLSWKYYVPVQKLYPIKEVQSYQKSPERGPMQRM